MTFADVRRQFAHWKLYPPVRDLVAGFVGVKPKEAQSATDDADQLGAFLAAVKAAGGGSMTTDMLPDK